MKGETLFSGGPKPEPCNFCGGTEFPLQVCKSAAGYYVGTSCSGCGAPESRETGYFTKEDAEKSLADIQRGDLGSTRAAQAGEFPGVAPTAGEA